MVTVDRTAGEGLPIQATIPRRRLAGASPRDLAPQAIWHAFPIITGNDEHRTALLRWYGISGPAQAEEEYLAALGYSHSWIRHLAARAANAVREQLHPLDEQQNMELTTPIESGEDIIARRRWSQLFGLPRPTLATAATGKRQHAFIDLAIRCIAALGPLTGPQLTAAITEIGRRRRHQRNDPHDNLIDVLRRAPQVHWDPGGDRYSSPSRLSRFSATGRRCSCCGRCPEPSPSRTTGPRCWPLASAAPTWCRSSSTSTLAAVSLLWSTS